MDVIDILMAKMLSGSGADPEAIASAVTDWLEENVDPVGSAVVVDSTLSIEGAAADAKAAGDALDEKISMPTGGTAGQVLKKTSGGVEWANESGGGSLPSGGTEGQVLTKTANGEAWQDAPTELPTGGTTGQVLKKTANGTEWANESGGSGGAPFEIEVTKSGSTYSTTATFAEIMAHKPNLIVLYDNLYYTLSYSATSDPNSWYQFVFSAQEPNNGELDTEWLFVECATNAVTVTAASLDIKGLPSVSSTDNGKSLVVENGAWETGNPAANVIAVMRSDGFLEITNADLIPDAESEVFGS